MKNEQVRIGGVITPRERRLINYLTVDERKNALVEAAKRKLKREEECEEDEASQQNDTRDAISA